VEELLLGAFLVLQELDVVDQEHVHVAVPAPEPVLLAVPDHVDEVVGELLRADVPDHVAERLLAFELAIIVMQKERRIVIGHPDLKDRLGLGLDLLPQAHPVEGVA
jgi:hypothetical protein